MPQVIEPQIPNNARAVRVLLIGASGAQLPIQMGADDFADNREQAARITVQSQGVTKAAILGNNPEFTTGSMSVPYISENNGLYDSFMDAILGVSPGGTAVTQWASESTGRTGSPFVEFYTLTMQVTWILAAELGGNVVKTYSKVHFIPTYASGTDTNKISCNWECYGGVTTTGPV